MSNRMPVDISGEGCMNTVAMKAVVEFDMYCPAMDQSECKSPHRVNYFKRSCSGRLKDNGCSFRGKCTIKGPGKKAEPDYIYRGIGIYRDSQRWKILADDGSLIRGSIDNIEKCRDIIDGIKFRKGKVRKL